MSYQIQFNFGAGWENIEAVITDLVFTEILHKNLKPADNSLKGKIIPDVALLNKMRGAGKDDIKARILEDDVALFTGYLRKSFDITKQQRLEPVGFEIVSPSNILKRKIKTDLFYAGLKIVDNSDINNSLLHSILIHAQIPLNDITLPSINYIASVIAVKEGSKTYHEIITEILFNYGYTFDFDANGKFITYNLFEDFTTTTNVFNGTNCLDKIKQIKKEEEKDVVEVKFYKIITKANQIVFSDSTGAAGRNKCNIPLAPNTFFGEDGAEEWWAEYGIEGKDLIAASDVTLNINKDLDIDVITYTPYNNRALLSIKNTNSTFIRNIRKLDLVGTAYIKDSINLSKVVNSDTDKIETIEANYIFDKLAGDNLAKKLASYYRFADFTYQLKSKTDYSLGDFVEMSDTGIGTSTCRIIGKTTLLIDKKYTYLLESISEYVAADTEYIFTIPNQNRTEIDIENRPTYEEVSKYGFITLYTRSALKPETPEGADPEGWSLSIPEGEDAIWMSGANFNWEGEVIGDWYVPVRFTGATTVLGILSNENHSIPVDSEGHNGDYTGAETEYHIFEGGTETTSLWVIGATPSAGITGTLVDNQYQVTEITTDVGFVDLIASRTGMSPITKRFSLVKSYAPAIAERLNLSTILVASYVDETFQPESLTIDGDSYLGIFKIWVNEILVYESLEPEEDYIWSDFPELESDIQIARIEMWNPDKSDLMDRQTVAFVKDVGFKLDDILAEIPDRVPKYLGRFQDSLPSEYTYKDWFLIYGEDDTPYQRGIYIVNQNLTTTRLTGDSGTNAPYMAAAMSDVLWATNNGFGDLPDYGSITYIPNLATNSVFAESIQIGMEQVTGLGALGELAWDDQVEYSKLGSTIIQGGYVKTELLDVNNILGTSAEFSGQLTAATGLFTGSIESGPLFLSISPPVTSSHTTNGKKTHQFVDGLVSSGIVHGTYLCSGNYNSQTIDKLYFQKSASYQKTNQTAYTYYWIRQYDQFGWPHLIQYSASWSDVSNNIPYALKFWNGSTVVLNTSGEAWGSGTWVHTGNTMTGTGHSGNENYPLPPSTPVTTAGNNCISLANGTVSFTNNAFTMRIVNLPGYSAGLPVGSLYLAADGANYTLKVKG